jgi:hypothetical protein
VLNLSRLWPFPKILHLNKKGLQGTNGLFCLFIGDEEKSLITLTPGGTSSSFNLSRHDPGFDLQSLETGRTDQDRMLPLLPKEVYLSKRTLGPHEGSHAGRRVGQSDVHQHLDTGNSRIILFLLCLSESISLP